MSMHLKRLPSNLLLAFVNVGAKKVDVAASRWSASSFHSTFRSFSASSSSQATLTHEKADPNIHAKSTDDDHRHGPRFSMAHTSYAGRKRFYKKVDIQQVEDKNEYKILLDHRTLKTPGKNPLHLPNIELAAMIALEWDAQLDKKGIQPATMPMMTLATTAIDQVQFDPEYARKTCLRYLPTDTALFFTSDEDRILLKKQKQVFQPIIRWLSRTLDIELETTQSMSGRLTHPKKSVEKIEKIVNSLDHFSLTCLQSATMECKSLVIALAMLLRHLSVDQAIVASRIEEEFQTEVWGVVEGGHDMDRLNNANQLLSSGCFLQLQLSAQDIQNIIDDVNKN
jgi:ATP synthase F1 complex assembly factor 2